MKTRTVSLAAALIACAVAPFAVPASAQNVDVIKERQQAMKTIGKAAKTAGQMIKGETPFDTAMAVELFTSMDVSAKKFGKLFPEDSKTGGDTEAAPAIWAKPDEFKAKLTKFQTDIATAVAAEPYDIAAFKASFQTVAQNCKSCHEEFRVDK